MFNGVETVAGGTRPLKTAVQGRAQPAEGKKKVLRPLGGPDSSAEVESEDKQAMNGSHFVGRGSF